MTVRFSQLPVYFHGLKLLTVWQQLFCIPCDLGDRINLELTDMLAPEDLLSSHLVIKVNIQQCEQLCAMALMATKS